MFNSIMTHLEGKSFLVSNLNRAERVNIYRAREEAMECERSGMIADWLEAEPLGSADIDYKVYSCEQTRGAHFTYGYTTVAEGTVWLQSFVRERCSLCNVFLTKDDLYLELYGKDIWDCPHCFPFGDPQYQMLYPVLH